MKLRLTAIAMTVSVLAIGPVYADGAGGCAYGSKYKYTEAEPQEQTEASRKLASLKVSTSEQEAAASAADKADASPSQAAEKTTTQ